MTAASAIQIAGFVFGCVVLRCTQKSADIITPCLVIAISILISVLLAVLAVDSGALSDTLELQPLGYAWPSVAAN